jgi:proteasome lid subunit RPN8/RPN11
MAARRGDPRDVSGVSAWRFNPRRSLPFLTVLVCAKPLLTRDQYGEIRCVPGVTRVDPQHWLPKLAPTFFQPVGGRTGPRERVYIGGSARLRAASVELPAEPRNLERWRLHRSGRSCRAGAGPSPVGVRVAPDAYADLVAEFERSDPRLEHGALLYGCRSRNLIEVVAVAPARGDRGRDSFRFDATHWRAQDRVMEQRGLVLVGDAHSHPGFTGAPSARDLDAWQARGRGESYLGLLMLRLRDGWMPVAWISSGGVCRRARL